MLSRCKDAVFNAVSTDFCVYASRWCAGSPKPFSRIPGLQLVTFTSSGLSAFEVYLFRDLNCKGNVSAGITGTLKDGKICGGDLTYWLPAGSPRRNKIN